MSIQHEAATQHLLRAPEGGFGFGYTPITREQDAPASVDFGIRRMRRGDEVQVGGAGTTRESIWVLLDGDAEFNWGCQGSCQVSRRSLFDEAPTTLHVDANTLLQVHAVSDTVEWAVIASTNRRQFEPRVFRPEDIEPEYRGTGMAQDTCLRNVRLIFDRARRPDSNIVLGEVVNYPGRWSSYPPHHHAQPELYHYRFTQPQGYGHGEVGEQVFRVRHQDTLRIPGGHDHAQVAAPGYGMVYLWIVRHLDDAPYDGFTFTPEHTWLLKPDARIWEPSDGPFPVSRGAATRDDSA